MLKRIFLPLLLLSASHVMAEPEMLKGMLEQDAVRVRYEALSQERREAVVALCLELESLFADIQQLATARLENQQDSLKDLKELLGAKEALNLSFSLGEATIGDATNAPEVAEESPVEATVEA